MSEPAFGALAVGVVKWFDRTDRREFRRRCGTVRKFGYVKR